MKQFSTNLVFAFGSGGFAAASAVLTVLKVISVVAGALRAVIGCLAAFYTLLNQWRIYQKHKGK